MLAEERRLRIETLEDQVALDEKKIVFLTGFFEPLLAVTVAVEDIYVEHTEKLQDIKPVSKQIKLLAPPSTENITSSKHYDILMQWINVVSSESHFRQNATVRGQLPEHFLPRVPPATSVESLIDGKLFSCAVVSLIFNSDAMKFVPILPETEEKFVEGQDTASVECSETFVESKAVDGSDHEGTAVESWSEKINYDVDESTPEAKAKVDEFVKLLSNINENRASPHDFISLSMAAAGYFLQIPIDDLEENLSLDSITCILYRVSYLRMFTLPVNEFKLALLPEELEMLREYQESTDSTRNKHLSALPHIQKIATLRGELAVTAKAPEDDFETPAENDSHNCGSEEFPESSPSEVKDVENPLSVESVEDSSLKEGGSISDKYQAEAQTDADEDVPEAMEGLSEEGTTIPKASIHHLHDVLSEIANSKDKENIVADFMDHLSNILVKLKTLKRAIDERRSYLDRNAVVDVYDKASNHGFVAQKTLNYLQF